MKPLKAQKLAAISAKRFTTIAAALLVIIGVFTPQNLFAEIIPGIPGNIFELEGNAYDDSDNVKDDWSNALSSTPTNYGKVVTRTEGGTAPYPGVLSDPPGKSLFVGGSKDISDISGWTCRDQSAPDKDELTNAYAVAYAVPKSGGGEDLVVFVGADRYDNSGTATMGFWLLQSAINQTACIPNGDGKFRDAMGNPASHAIGDILIVADFTNGGAIGTVRVFKWVGSGGSAGSLDLIFEALAGANPNIDCSKGVAGDLCGTINQSPVDSPWMYVPKGSGADSPFIRFGFMEIGVNLSRIFTSGTIPCFSTFIAETRSSAEPNAAQKDFVLGSFNVCKIGASKTCGRNTPDLSVEPVKFLYDIGGCLENSGFGAVTNINIVDNPALDSGTLKLFRPAAAFDVSVCSNIAALEDEAAKGTQISSTATLNPGERVIWLGKFTSTSNGGSDTMTATAQGAGGGPWLAPANATATCPSKQFNPGINVTKNCSVNLQESSGQLVVKSRIWGEVCNTGDTPLNNVTVYDSTSGGSPGYDLPYPILSVSRLQTTAPNNCASYDLVYTPSKLPTATGSQYYKFVDDVTASGTPPTGTGITQTATGNAECSLCPECPPCPAATTSPSTAVMQPTTMTTTTTTTKPKPKKK